jgi:predicted RNA-binding protein with PUA-like domain
MARRYWIMKTEPEAYSFEDLVREGSTEWDGVRNYQARNNMREMSVGDLVLIYHSVGPKDFVGIARVSAEAHPDSTTDDERWECVDIEPVKSLEVPVNLATVKADAKLQDIALVKHSRLSVAPLTAAEFRHLLKLGKTKLD